MKDIIAEFTKKMEEYERNESRLRIIAYVMEASDTELEELMTLLTDPGIKQPAPPHPFHGNVAHDISRPGTSTGIQLPDEADPPDSSTVQHYVSLCGDFKHPSLANVHKHEGHCKKCKTIAKASTPKKYVSLVVEEVKTPTGTVFRPPCGKLFASKASAQAHMGRCKECRKAAGAPAVKHRPRRRTTTCRICNKKFKGNAGLGLHLRKTHGMSYVEYDASYAGYGKKHK